MKVIITGATGFIGSYLLHYLLENTHHIIVGVSRNHNQKYIVKSNYYDNLPEGDVLIHLGENSNISEVQSSQNEYLESQEKKALSLCKSYKKIIYFSSAVLYGDKSLQKLKTTNPVFQESIYQKVKSSVECTLSNCTNLVILRISNVYGNYPKRGTIFFDIFNQLQGDEIKLLTLNSIRDYIHINDVATLIIRILDNFNSGVFNVGTGKGVSSVELAKTILSIANLDLNIKGEYLGSYSGIILDISKTIRMFNWKPSWELSDGIREMWEKWTENR